MTNIARRLDQLEQRRTATSVAASPHLTLVRKLGLLSPESRHAPQWFNYSPEAIALEAHVRISELERKVETLLAGAEALISGVVPWPDHITDEGRRRQHCAAIARDIGGARASIRLLTDVRTTAGLDVGRHVEEHDEPRLLPRLADMSTAELVTLRARYLMSTPPETETPTS
jgi:hypothetical protein